MSFRLRDEHGVALPVATWMLVIVSLLVAGAFTVSSRLSDSTVDDRAQKRALAAAEAGLQTAVQRLNQIRTPAVPSTHCLTTQAILPTAGECPAAPWEDLGNNSSFTYYVTPHLGTTGTCMTLPTVTVNPTDRCVTAVGTASGITRRLQVRVVEQQGSIGYTQIGVVGDELVETWNSDELHSDVGSNQEVDFGNSTKLFADSSLGVEGGVTLAPGATPGYHGGASVTIPGGVDTVAAPFELPQVDFETVENNNNNAVLPATRYNSTTRRFRVDSGTYTFPPGTYHFCRLYLGNSVNLQFSSSALTQIYIDSPARTDSVCNNAGADVIHDGTFNADNSVTVNEVGGHEEFLEIYMYGTGREDTRPRYSETTGSGWNCDWVASTAKPSECTSDFMLDNSVKFWGTVYAPNSTVQAHNSVEWYGAVAANKIRFFNSIKFWLTDAVKNKPSGTQGASVRRGWSECNPTPTVGTDPESGC
jgi:type II secretory pathway pseudopilin PulG